MDFAPGLKLVGYGCTPSAFMDYFQMGETTARQCLLRLCTILSSHPDFTSIYLRTMSRSDAKKVSQLHKEQHGVSGMIGCLDCMHVSWKNCPVAWQGQTTGKEKKPTIVLEAFTDYNLFFWHASFGWAGTLNDINIWDRSLLLKSFLDGTFSNEVDFEFKVGDQEFTRLWLLVDGIYPEISRFVKTIQEPIGKNLSNYAKWQESSRKSVERAFGVLQRKFHIIVKANEQWYVDDIANIVVSTIVLHNMMVCHRVSSDENEDISFYECVSEEDDGSIIVNNNHNNDNSNNHNNNQQDLGCEEEYINRRQAELDLHRRLELEALDGAPSIVPLFTQQKRI